MPVLILGSISSCINLNAEVIFRGPAPSAHVDWASVGGHVRQNFLVALRVENSFPREAYYPSSPFYCVVVEAIRP